MDFSARMAHVAIALLLQYRSIQIRKFLWSIIAGLWNHYGIIQRTAIDPGRSSGFHSATNESKIPQLFGNSCSRPFACPTPSKLFFADMDKAVQESSVCEHNRLGSYLEPQRSPHADYSIILDQKPADHLLIDITVRSFLQSEPPFFRKSHTVALCTWTPHRRPLGFIQHLKLDGGFVSDNSAIATKGINLTNNLPFGYAPHSWIARHLPDGLQVHGHQQGFGAHVGGGGGGLRTGVASSYSNDIVWFWEHCNLIYRSQLIECFEERETHRNYRQRIAILIIVPRGTILFYRFPCPAFQLFPLRMYPCIPRDGVGHAP